MLIKRSVTLNGHATSIALEAEFWTEIERLAGEAGLPLAHFVARVDTARKRGNLASALRLKVLEALKSAKNAPDFNVPEASD